MKAPGLGPSIAAGRWRRKAMMLRGSAVPRGRASSRNLLYTRLGLWYLYVSLRSLRLGIMNSRRVFLAQLSRALLGAAAFEMSPFVPQANAIAPLVVVAIVQ